MTAGLEVRQATSDRMVAKQNTARCRGFAWSFRARARGQGPDHVTAGSVSYPPVRSRSKAASSITGTPKFVALSSLLPASAPATR